MGGARLVVESARGSAMFTDGGECALSKRTVMCSVGARPGGTDGPCRLHYISSRPYTDMLLLCLLHFGASPLNWIRSESALPRPRYYSTLLVVASCTCTSIHLVTLTSARVCYHIHPLSTSLISIITFLFIALYKD